MQINGDEFLLFGTVGDMWFDESFTAVEVINGLAARRGKPISVRINSGGGLVDEGTAIYNALKNHDGDVTVYIDGVAASAATIIAMAGKEIIMRTGSVMMIHDPLTSARGNAGDMAKAIEMLEAHATAMADLYAKRTGRPAADIRAEMKSELWLTGEEAVAKGYADRTDTEAAVEAAAFDYRVYMRTPEPILALADERKWSNRPQGEHQQRSRLPMPSENKTPATPPAATVDAAATQAAIDTALAAERVRVQALTELCTAEKELGILGSLIADNASVEAARKRIEGNKGIRAAVETARKTHSGIEASLADQFIAEGKSLEQASADLFRRITALQSITPTKPHHGSTASKDGLPAAASLWDDAIKDVNATLPSASKAV